MLKQKYHNNVLMRMLPTFFILCTVFCTGCGSKSVEGYDLGIAAYKRGHYQAALFDFEQRANQGDPVAQFCLGFMHKHHQVPVPEKFSKNVAGWHKMNAAEWYIKAAEQGYPMALNNIGLIWLRLYEQSDKREDLENARKSFQRAASKGYPPAQYNLYIVGRQAYIIGKPADTALEWLRKAAEQGFPPAQDRLGNLYYHGEEVDKEPEAAVKWFRVAADQGYASAQTNLGICYAKGMGVRKNQEAAFNWYKKAAEQNHTAGQFTLGQSYHFGKGVEVDLQQAFYWYKKAAEQEHLEAQNNLAYIYINNMENSEMGSRWHFRAAQQGHAIAQRNIGKSFEDKLHDMPLDSREAYYWYSLALQDRATLDRVDIENLAEAAEAARDCIEESLKDQQIRQIQKRIKSWKSKQFQGAGTGFYVHKNWILTNAHVVTSHWAETREDRQPVYGDEFCIPYRHVILKEVDHENDLALLYDERGNTDENGNAVTAKFRSKPIDFGENISVFGYPQSTKLSYEGNLTSGIISGLSYPIDYSKPENGFQHTAPMQRGNSGGPVFDAAGKVIGVCVSVLSDYKSDQGVMSKELGFYIPQIINLAQNINFAIHFDVITDFLKAHGITPLEEGLTVERLEEHLKNPNIPLQTIKNEAKKFTVPVLRFKNKVKAPFRVRESTIDELK